MTTPENPVSGLRELPTPPPREGFWEELHELLLAESTDNGLDRPPLQIAPGPLEKRKNARPGVWLVAVAAAAALVVVGVAVSLQRTSSNQTPTNVTNDSAPTIGVTVPASTVAPDTTEAAPDTTEAAAGMPLNSGWFVPTWVPDGLQIASAQATRADPAAGSGLSYNAWIDRSTGRRLRWSSILQTSVAPNPPIDSTTVRGLPARVTDDGDSIAVQWSEAGRTNMVSGTVDYDTALAVIEGATIDQLAGVSVDVAALPPELEWIDPALSDPPAAYGLTTALSFRDFDGAERRSLSVGVSPNTTRLELDSDPERGGALERREINGIEHNLWTGLREDGNPWTQATWYDDGFAFSVQAENIDAADVEAFIAGITPADETGFLAFEHDITDRGTASPIYDQATFADGLTVTLRSPDSEAFTSVDAWAREGYMCLDAQQTVCAAPGSGGSSGGGEGWQVEASWLFNIDGTKTLIKWISGEPQDLDVTANDEPPDLDASSGDPIPFENVTGANGTFVRVPLPVDARSVTVHRPSGYSGEIVPAEILDLPIATG